MAPPKAGKRVRRTPRTLEGKVEKKRRGFQRGGANVRALHLEHRATKKAEKMAAARKRKLTLRTKYGAQHAAVTGQAVRAKISPRERSAALRAVGEGRSQEEAAAMAHLSQQSVSNLVRRQAVAERRDLDGQAAAAVTPPTRKRKGGRPLVVTPRKYQCVRVAFRADPCGTVADVGAVLAKKGLQVSNRTLLRTRKRVLGDDKPFTKRVICNYEDESDALINWHYAWLEAIRRAVASKALTWRQLCYMDQTPIRIGCGSKVGYSDRSIYGAYALKGGRMVYSLWAVISNFKCLRAWLTKKGGGSETAHEFMLSAHPPAGWIHVCGESGTLFEVMARDSKRIGKKLILVADRLGRSGSTFHPCAGHYSPALKAAANTAGVGYILLPPKGAFQNPIENWNMDVKQEMDHIDTGAVDAWLQKIRGARDEAEAVVFCKRAVAAITPERLRSYYHRRAEGDELTKRYKHHVRAQAVLAKRNAVSDEEKEAGFSFVDAAFAPRMFNDHHAWPSTKTRAVAYNTYYYAHFIAGLAEGLPPPFAEPADADGNERWCRSCPRAEQKKRRPDLLACDKCPAAFCLRCCGLKEAPSGEEWECPCCVRGGACTPVKWRASGEAAWRGASGDAAGPLAEDVDGENLLAEVDDMSDSEAPPSPVHAIRGLTDSEDEAEHAAPASVRCGKASRGGTGRKRRQGGARRA